jgi:hypothetical protein
MRTNAVKTCSLIGCLLAACTGDFLAPPKNAFDKSDLAANPAIFDAQAPDARKATCDAGAAPLPLMPQLPRISHAQYDNALRDLLGVTTHPSQNFSPDPGTEGFDNNVFALAVSDTLARDYRRNAEDTAVAITSDPTQLAAVLGCSPTQGDACATAFIARFVSAAYRRPIASDEAAAYLALFQNAPNIFDTGDMFVNGVRLVIEAALQSPNFIYRPQIAPVGQDLQLDDLQIASQLSFMLWDSIPDSALSAAASAGQLHTADQIAAQATRMLQDPKARPTLTDFHDQALHTETFATLQKDATKYPQFTPAVADAMKAEVRRFTDYVVFDASGGVQTLFNAPYTFVNAQTAPLYGLTGTFGADLVKVDLNPSERAGLITQVGFLAVNAHAADTSPILRGVHIQRDFLCASIPQPPSNIDRTLPPLGANIHTQRDRIEAVTSAQACTGCHTLINAPGFTLEGFDALGQKQTSDNGYPVNTAANVTIDGTATDFANGVALAQAIATSEQARRCYATKLTRYAYQRKETGEDLCVIDRVTDKLADPSYSIKQLLVDLTQSRSMTTHTVAGGTP